MRRLQIFCRRTPAGQKKKKWLKIIPGLDGELDWHLPGSGLAQLEASRCTCGLLDLLFEDEDALPLLWRQHGDLLRGQLQHLHDESSLEDATQKKRGVNITPRHTREDQHLKLKPKACFFGSHVSPLIRLLHNKENNRFKRLFCHRLLLFLHQAFSLAGWLCVLCRSSTHLLLILWWNLALAWTEASSRLWNRRHPWTLEGKNQSSFLESDHQNLVLFIEWCIFSYGAP